MSDRCLCWVGHGGCGGCSGYPGIAHEPACGWEWNPNCPVHNPKFRIRRKDGYHLLPWRLDYPGGFDELNTGKSFLTFDDAVEAFIEADQRRCPMCSKGAVVDTDWGWECQACGSNDVAVGCVKPADTGVRFELTEASS